MLRRIFLFLLLTVTPADAHCGVEEASGTVVAADAFSLTITGPAGTENVTLAGVVLPDPVSGDAPARAVAARLAEFVGTEVVLAWTGGASDADRYNRRAAVPLIGGVSIQETLLAEGLLLASGETGCAAAFLAAEDEARRAGRGLWRQPVVRAASDPELQLAAPGFLLVEGRVDSIGFWRDRAYLNFGGRFSEDFTVVLIGLVLDQLGGETGARGLQGLSVRVRGWAEPHNGVEIRLSAPAALEIVEAADSHAATPGIPQ